MKNLKVLIVTSFCLILFSCNNSPNKTSEINSELPQDSSIPDMSLGKKIENLNSILTQEGAYWISESGDGTKIEYLFLGDGTLFAINNWNKKKIKGNWHIDEKNKTLQTVWESGTSYLANITEISNDFNLVAFSNEIVVDGDSGFIDVDVKLKKLKLLDNRFDHAN